MGDCNGNGGASEHSPAGASISLDLWGIPFQTLNQPFLLSEAAKHAAQKAGMQVLAITIVPFQPQGFSLVIILAESHLCVHTSPEYGYAAIDIFTCGNGNPLVAANYLIEMLKPDHHSLKELLRGMRPEPITKGIERIYQPREVEFAQR